MTNLGLPQPAVLLCMLSLCFIAALPRIFFRRGRLNLQWWLTAAPFALAGAALLQHWLLDTGVDSATNQALHFGALVLAAASIALIAFTLGTHRQPVSLWHQHDDRPASLVTYGAYARIRHPFYSAFLLALAACVLAVPGPLAGAAALAGLIQLTRTALREERRLSRDLGEEYVVYMRRTGRFLPRVVAGSTSLANGHGNSIAGGRRAVRRAAD